MSYFDEREPKNKQKQAGRGSRAVTRDTRKGAVKTLRKAMRKAARKTKVKFDRNAKQMEALIYSRARNKDVYMFMVASLVVQLTRKPDYIRIAAPTH